MKKILITGCNGQLGKTLTKEFSNKTKRKNGQYKIIFKSKKDFDITNKKKCEDFIYKENPDWVINAAAYTNVDMAEKEKDLAYAVNSLGPEFISNALLKTGGKLIHISTDYVFSGEQSFPYKTDSERKPINIYGKTKVEGEIAIESILIPQKRAKIIRTSWLIGHVGKNFLTKIINLLKNKASLNIVDDQISSPTTTKSLSEACYKMIIDDNSLSNDQSIFHWSDSGVASWYDLTKYICKICLNKGLLKSSCKIEPISSKNFPTLAIRPKFSKLDCKSTQEYLQLKNNYWQESIEDEIEKIRSSLDN